MVNRKAQEFGVSFGGSALSRRRLIQGTAALAGGAMLSPLAARAQEEAPAAKPSSTIEPFDAGGETLRIASWGGFWEELERKHLLNDFEQEFNCKVEYDSSFPWFAKFVAGGVDNPPFDAAHWNLPDLYKTARAGDFFVPMEELEANVPQAADLWPFSRQSGLGLTILYSGYGYGYRTDTVDPVPTTFREFWDERFADKRATYITSNTLQMVFFMMAAQEFSGDPHNIEAGVQAMRDAMPMKISDFTGNMTALLERGEVDICVQTDGEILSAIDRGLPFGWMTWPDMNPVLTQTKTVSKGSSDLRKRLAYAYIDRACSPEFQEAMGRDIYMRPTNRNATVFEGMAAQGVTNEEESASTLFIPDWNWYLDNEQDIVEQVNEIFGQ